jgi:hypothetical protein
VTSLPELTSPARPSALRPPRSFLRPLTNGKCGRWQQAGIAIGAATCIAPRCCGVFDILIFIPLSDEISIESTLDSSSISTSFFT